MAVPFFFKEHLLPLVNGELRWTEMSDVKGFHNWYWVFFLYKLIFLTVFYQRRWLPVVCHLRHGDWRVPVAIAIAGPAVANVAKSPMSGRFISRVEFSWVLPGFYRVLPGFTGFFFWGTRFGWQSLWSRMETRCRVGRSKRQRSELR